MKIEKLRTELNDDILGRGYSGMTDEAAANSLNDTIDRSLNRATMTASEVFNAVDAAEFAGLDGEQLRVQLHRAQEGARRIHQEHER